MLFEVCSNIIANNIIGVIGWLDVYVIAYVLYGRC